MFFFNLLFKKFNILILYYYHYYFNYYFYIFLYSFYVILIFSINTELLLVLLLILPLISCIILNFFSHYSIFNLRIFSLLISSFIVILTLYLWFILIIYNQEYLLFYFNYKNYNFFIFSFNFFISGTHFIVNKISILFIFLVSLLIFISLLLSWNWLGFYYSLKIYYIILFFLEFACIGFFMSSNFLIFYIFFESVLIPMFFLIGIWGLRDRKIHATYQFFFYTFFGSIFMLISLLIINLEFGSYSFLYSEKYWWFFGINYELGIFIWLCLFLSFIIKVPLVPFHIWLPEAHVEAPTSGSIILAGVLLKFGTYGIYKVLLLNFPFGFEFFKKFIIILSIISILYASIITYILIDLKKVIAYSSISHMGYVILGLSLDNLEGIIGAILMMITHGFISGSLFYSIGLIYERYGSRNIFYYNSLKNIMPLYTFFFFFLTLSNMNLPLTGGFIAEILVLLGTVSLSSKYISFFACLGLFTNGIYCIWLFNRLCFGSHKIVFKNNNVNFYIKNIKIIEFFDIDFREIFIFIIFLFLIIFLGICPSFILESFEKEVYFIFWGKHFFF